MPYEAAKWRIGKLINGEIAQTAAGHGPSTYLGMLLIPRRMVVPKHECHSDGDPLKIAVSNSRFPRPDQ